MRKNNVNISFYLIQTFGGNIWPSNYCWSHHKVGHFCPKMRLKETGKNLGRIWQRKFHLQARFSIEIHFYFQTLRLSCSTFCLLLKKILKKLPAFSVTDPRFQNNNIFFFKKASKKYSICYYMYGFFQTFKLYLSIKYIFLNNLMYQSNNKLIFLQENCQYGFKISKSISVPAKAVKSDVSRDIQYFQNMPFSIQLFSYIFSLVWYLIIKREGYQIVNCIRFYK